MPPKAKISRQQISDAAFSIVREGGEDSLTAKSLAAKLHCSTQPIFWLFEGMEEVRKEVYVRALETFAQYLREKREDVSAYKAIGLNYIRFASEETQLFKLLFMSKSAEGKDILSAHEEMQFVLGVLADSEKITGQKAKDIYEEMWLFSHGIATMIATGTAKFSFEKICSMLSDVYKGLTSGKEILE